ncbi:MAG: hypothetical protein Kow0047_34040 [Anaerolineae bacterium]
MREYELVYILDPRLDEEAITAAIERISGWITASGGEIVDTNQWGRRELAYPINKQWEGYYVVQQLRMTPQAVADLERNLRISEEVMRHLIVRPGA